MSLRKRVQRQLEFYLGDSNYRKDKFLQQNTDENGYIPVDLFLQFSRMKQLKATKRSLQDAASKSDFLLLSKDELHIKRKFALPAEDTTDDRTIYVEGFSPGQTDHDVLRKLFSKLGKVEHVSLPRFKNSRKFKGYAFVEFSKEEDVNIALKAVNDEPSPSKAKETQESPFAHMKALAKHRWLGLKEALKKHIHEESTASTGTLRGATEKVIEHGSTAMLSNTEHSSFFTKGLILCFENLNSRVTRREMRDLLEKISPVAYVDDSSDRLRNRCYARFLSTSHVENVVSHFTETPLVLYGDAVNVFCLSGEEEQQYWEKIVFKQVPGSLVGEADGNDRESNLEEKSRSTHVRFDQDGGAGADETVQHIDQGRALKRQKTE